MKLARLDKVICDQGVVSRNDVKKMIRSGSVKVDGVICKKSDCKVDVESCKIEILGKELILKSHIYIMMNKPAGVLSASTDKNATTVIDLLPLEYKRKNLFPAGRLDKDTTGLIIITDDGEYAHKMLSPKNKVYKRYITTLDGEFTQEMKATFEKGLYISEDLICKPAFATLIDKEKNIVQIDICEGKFHQVKRMFKAVGLTVISLKRISIGSLKLDANLNYAECKILQEKEKDEVFICNMT